MRGVGAPPEEMTGGLLGGHPSIQNIIAKIDLIARSSVPVLILGESGTGKEIVARMIHSRSERANRSAVALNCAALPRDVIENELFGHEREAFSGATSSRRGCFDLAQGSTLFLDEIGEMHHQVQAKLLRAIENKAFRRLGGHEDIHVDVRIVAATNRDIPASLASGALREDLYYRLSVVELTLPPLRERAGDIPLLADHFLRCFAVKYGTTLKVLTAESMEIFTRYSWPGNVRELKNLIESLVLLCPTEEISTAELPVRLTRSTVSAGEAPPPTGVTLADAERGLIMRTMEQCGGNKSEAARLLGISRKALYDKLRRHALPAHLRGGG